MVLLNIVSQVVPAHKARVPLCVLYVYYYYGELTYYVIKTIDTYWLVILPLNICPIHMQIF